MRGEVKQYLCNCHVCKQAKTSRNAYNRLFQSLLVLKKLWVDLTIDFIVGLPKSQGYDAILMVVDQLLKEKHYKLRTEEGKTNVEATAAMFICYVWCYHGLPVSLTFDQSPQFSSKIWNLLCRFLEIKAKLLPAWNSKTDGQSKIANQEMKCYLCSYVNHFQDNWVEQLPMAKFSSNSSTSATTKVLPFLVSCGYILQMSFDPVDLTASSTRKRLANTRARLIADCMQKVWKFTRDEIAKSQWTQVNAANRHQKTSTQYKISNPVYLLTKNIHIKRLSKS